MGSSNSPESVKSLPNAIQQKTPKSVLDTIGIDPIVELTKFRKKNCARIFAKIEFTNPSGSVKDVMAAYCISEAEKRGELKKGYTIVEATSGNTGVAVAMVAAAKSYRAVLVMPEGTSGEKKDMMRFFGARLVLVPDRKGMAGVVGKAKQIAKRKSTWMLNQFENPDNPRSHMEFGREVLAQLGRVDAFVASIGTGGTLIGVAKVLKKKNPKTKIIAVEPKAVPAFYNMFYGKSLPVKKGIAHKIEGIGEGFVPKILSDNIRFVDEVMLVSDNDAIRFMKLLAKKEGLCAGVSSGANVWAAAKIAKRFGEGKAVVTLLPDTGMRYL